MNKMNFKKVSRRVLSLAMLTTFTITLASCNSNTNAYGNLDSEAVYATSGNKTITNKELWDELKWSAVDELTSQISNVVIIDYANKVSAVIKTEGSYSKLADEYKEEIKEEDFEGLYNLYHDRLVDYVVQDIYNYTFSNGDYWTNIESTKESDLKKLEAQYLDDIYKSTKTKKIGNDNIADLISNVGEDNSNNYFTIAKAFPEIYYPLFAKEVYSLEQLYNDADDADADDDDAEDDNIGKYTKTQYVTKFKSLYANQFDLGLVQIRFSSETEFTNTLRAFGIKIYNRQYYFVKGNEEVTTYDQYVKYYNDFTITANTPDVYNLSSAAPEVLLQMYVEIYNYVYSGYRSSISTGYSSGIAVSSLNDLRKITEKVYDDLVAADSGTSTYNYEAMTEELKATSVGGKNPLLYTREDLDGISTTYATYLYETIQLEDNDTTTTALPYSTGTQNYNDSYYIAYKFFEDEADYKDLYNVDLTNDEIFDNFSDDEHKAIFDEVRDALIVDSLSETSITNYIKELTDTVSVKIYNEVLEIGYIVANTEYSKTLSGASNPNILATLTYNGKTYNINLKADENDESGLKIAGTDKAYGVFDTLEASSGETTAINLLSTKCIMDTKAYEDTAKDIDTYKDYIEALLYNFSNDSYSSSGYASSIGKYNFMMLYFHDVNIDNIVNNYYRVSFASAKLLTDYSNDTLIDFFKTYTDLSLKNYFSIDGTRLVVFYDEDDDGEADETVDWKNKSVRFDFGDGEVTTSLGVVAKYLVLEINNEVSASTGSHVTKMTEIASEINTSGKVAYDGNPVLAENQWAKYRHIGLNVLTEEYSCTNSTTTLDSNLKQRLYDYANGSGKVDINAANLNADVEYQFYINDTTPTEYIQPYDTTYNMNSDVLSLDNTEIVETNDGYNLIVATTSSTSASAKWTEEDNNDGLLDSVTVKYNDNDVTVTGLYNDDKALNANQIKLYVLEYSQSQTSNLLPSDISDAVTSFLSPVYTRYTDEATQSLILLYFLQINSGELTFTDSTKNDILDEIIAINERVADNYNEYIADSTKTSDNFVGWWDALEDVITEIIKEAE